MRLGLVSPVFSYNSRVYSTRISLELARSCDVFLYVNERGLRVSKSDPIPASMKISTFRTPAGATFPNALLNSVLGSKTLAEGASRNLTDVTHSLQISDALSSDVTTLNNLPPSTLAESYRHGRPFWFPSLTEKIYYTTLDLTFLVPPFIRHIAQRGCKILIAPSTVTRDEAVKTCGVPFEKVEVIPYGIDYDAFSGAGHLRSETRIALGVAEDEILLAFASVEVAFFRKGLDLLIGALALTPKTKLLVIGADSLPPFFRNLATRLNVLARIVCVKTPDVGRYLGAADMFVLPSLHDTFAMVVLEAMACGLPVIISSHVGAKDLLTEGYDSLFLECPESVRELAEKIQSLISDPDFGKLLGKRAQEKARISTWKQAARRHLDVYEDVSRR